MASKTLQRLMETALRGQPLDPQMLRDCGVSAQQTTYLVNAGWLQRLSKGAYLLAGDTPARDGVLAYLSRHVTDLHVGGKTALDWQGARHAPNIRERVTLWAGRPYVMPAWVGEALSHTLQTTQLFDEDLPDGFAISPLPHLDPSILVSEPERALLELASDIGKRHAKGQSLEEAFHIASSLSHLRPKVLDTLLAHCTRVKVVKLVRDLGDASGFAWGKDLQRHVDRLGPGKRWTSSRKGAPALNLKA
ncbi:AbiEi_3_N domain-containing protein [Paraburkholderia unamae]|uniref:type IV toxin-antitoxin system AbiEi family antitoxin domain-containing protein n=1 Tax=Paraburkholderia unamae TaxID=219649 RepID=UPI001CAF1473|nr:type IV toxin-antitoxin system AbiEi family antitoxin domain-containing protein [Paraburkholderia unamae]CAG9265212.1 AbiEi_3_N domain-containing protein [Paraburkholderia unamae]